MIVARADEALKAAGIPIHGVALRGDGTLRVDFRAEATTQHRDQANNVLAALDGSVVADQAWRNAQVQDRTALRNAAAQAIADNDAYLALSNPTNAQMRTQLEALTRQATRLIRFASKLN